MIRLYDVTRESPVGHHVHFSLLFCILLPTKSLISRFTLGTEIKKTSTRRFLSFTPNVPLHETQHYPQRFVLYAFDLVLDTLS
jgi:hypothetical protein